MNQRRIDRLIPIALKLLDTVNPMITEIFTSQKKLKSIYKGYMNSIGPSIGQAGLIKTLTAFNKSSGSEGTKSITCELIKSLLKEDSYYTSEECTHDLLRIVTERIAGKSTHVRLCEEDRILECIASYKLVFDTYVKSTEKEDKHEVENAD